ncbi:MAG: class I SAM-dependent methyltransferase [Minisyncoccia bacterium]
MYQDTFPVAEKLKHLVFDWTGLSVVEIGCNTGQLGDYVLKQGAASYRGSDMNAEWLGEGQRRYPHLNLTVGRAQDADLRADVLVALGVFHHMSDFDVIGVLAGTTARVLLIEQPMRAEPFQGYKMRPKDWYKANVAAVGFTSVKEFKYGFTYPVPRSILLVAR